MKKKSILMAAIAVMLVAVLVVGGTLAYFTDTKSATNTFTVGDVKIKLDESNVNDPDGDRVTSNEYTGMLPGIQYKKDPVVTNTGKNGAYVRAVAGGLVVSELNVVFRAEGLAGFIRGLVEGLVGDVTVVRDHGDLVRSGIFAAVVLVAAAGAKREDHDERKEQSNKLLHVHAIFPP